MSAEYDDDTTIKRVVELAKYEVGEESNGAIDFIFEQWAAQGASSLDNKQTYAVVGHEGDVVCGRVKKPCVYIRFISAHIENIEYPYVNSDGMVSRRAHNGIVLLGPSAWSAAVNALMPQTAIVNLAIGTENDPGTRELSLEVEHYCTSSSPGSPDRLHVLLTEDHITAYQANYGPGGAQAAYDHRHALRAALTPFEGHALGSGAQGETGAATFGYTLPESWNAANVRVVAFIAEENGEVHQVAEAMATGSSTMIPDQQPGRCSSSWRRIRPTNP